MIYKFKEGSFIRANPYEAGRVCEELARKNNLTAKALVDVSRPEDAPLHDEFDWNDTTAAESWREHQARHIIACLEIVTEKHEPIRAFYNIVRQEPQYRHIETIMENADDAERLFQMAYKELQMFQRKYAQLESLRKVFRAIEELDVPA